VKKNNDSLAEILETLRQARAYRLQAESEIDRQLAVLDIIEAVYGPSIPVGVENDSVIE